MDIIKTFSECSGIPQHRILLAYPSKTGYAHLSVLMEAEDETVPGRIISLGSFETSYLGPEAPTYREGVLTSFIQECVHAYYDASRRETGGTPPLERTNIHWRYRKPETPLFPRPLGEHFKTAA